jgi:hypothetical protein
MPSEPLKIACLGWGSLIWDPRTLPIRRPWFQDGPLLPIEFARRSDNGHGRITLVIVPPDCARVPCVRALWALMTVDSFDDAIERLAEREMPKNPREKAIGRWSFGATATEDFPFTDLISTWAQKKGLDAVVWTALPPKNERDGEMPTIDAVLQHLHGLAFDYSRWREAEEYVRKAPMQIDTEYRRRIECEFGWTPVPASS